VHVINIIDIHTSRNKVPFSRLGADRTQDFQRINAMTVQYLDQPCRFSMHHIPILVRPPVKPKHEILKAMFMGECGIFSFQFRLHQMTKWRNRGIVKQRCGHQ